MLLTKKKVSTSILCADKIERLPHGANNKLTRHVASHHRQRVVSFHRDLREGRRLAVDNSDGVSSGVHDAMTSSAKVGSCTWRQPVSITILHWSSYTDLLQTDSLLYLAVALLLLSNDVERLPNSAGAIQKLLRCPWLSGTTQNRKVNMDLSTKAQKHAWGGGWAPSPCGTLPPLPLTDARSGGFSKEWKAVARSPWESMASPLLL